MKVYDGQSRQYRNINRDGILSCVKPIETRYNGYRFRSRTEARWAVFFDGMGWNYEYEKEGYQLLCGPYLPDFWLPFPEEYNFSGYPNAGHWVEIKGYPPSQAEISKLLLLSIETKHSGLLICGTPWNFEVWCTNRNGGCVLPNGRYDDETDDMYGLKLLFHNYPGCHGTFCDAVEKSKSARFEFGEKHAGD